MEEVWKDIPGYEGFYEVSNFGRVKSLHLKPKILNPKAPSHRYKRVSLSVGGVKKQHSVHRLVLLAFIGPSNLQVNHIDGDKNNNTLTNLEYCTPKENINHAWDTGVRKRSVDINGEKIIIDYNSGVTLTDLVKRYRVDIRDLKEFLRKNNVEIRPQRSYMTKVSDSKFINLFNESRTTSEIAEEVGVDIATVINRRKNLENRNLIKINPVYQRKPRIKKEVKSSILSYLKENPETKNIDLSKRFSISEQSVGRILKDARLNKKLQGR